MSKFVLIPGAGGMAWYWHRLVPELTARNHQGVAVDLPGDDESVGLPEYAEAVVAAIGSDRDVVVVAQSLGGFTGAAVCSRVPVRLLVLVNAMIPLPGETPGQWFANTGSEEARIDAANRGGYPADLDIGAYALHGVPREVLASGEGTYRDQARVVMSQPCQIDRWPSVPTRILVGGGRPSLSAGVPAPACSRTPRPGGRAAAGGPPRRAVSTQRARRATRGLARVLRSWSTETRGPSE